MTGDESYHADCFTCRQCAGRIEELVFAKTSQGIYCMVRVSTPNQPIQPLPTTTYSRWKTDSKNAYRHVITKESPGLVVTPTPNNEPKRKKNEKRIARNVTPIVIVIANGTAASVTERQPLLVQVR